MHASKFLCLGLMFFTSANSAGWTQESDPDRADENAEIVPAGEIENEKVESLFESFRDESYRGRRFPELDVEDIPALLVLGESERQLKDFPRSMISSQYEPTCREGIVALWLVEGIRKGGRFPSLNALCLSKKAGNDWTANSESNHKQVLDAYRKWWKDTKELPFEEAQEINPIKRIGLHWH